MNDLLIMGGVAALGLVCGFVNVVAGGGSFLALPALIFCGLPPTVANGTNRVALLVQNLVAVRDFHRRNMLDWQAARRLILPLLIGALVGARIAVSVDQQLMTLAIAVAMVVLFVIMLWNPTRLRTPHRESGMRPGWRMLLAFFLIGIYGGFIQAGSGLFILILLMAAGHEQLRASAIRLLLILLYTPLALAVFVYSAQVDWRFGLTLAVGNALGAMIGIKVAVQRGVGFARAVLLIVLLCCSGKLFYDGLFGF